MTHASPFSAHLPPLFDLNSAAEAARLIQREWLMNHMLRGLLPELADLSSISSVLDLACGPGGWAVDLASRHQDLRVLGLEQSELMLGFARALAQGGGWENVRFQCVDLNQPLDLPERSFDLIMGRFLTERLDQRSWSALVAECWRVLRPGGILCLREWEVCLSASPALQRLLGWLCRAMQEQQRGFSGYGHSLGIAPLLSKLLTQAGYQQVQQRPFLLNASYESEIHYTCFRFAQQTVELLKPFLLGSGLVTEGVYEHTVQAMTIEMLDERFSCHCFGVSTWGVKPALA